MSILASPFAGLPPIPADPADMLRCEHTRLRKRLLYGLWTDDLRLRLKRMMGTTRADIIGEPDLSANPFSATCNATAALYDRAPRITHPAGGDVVRDLSALVTSAGLWAQMQRTMRDTLGLREMLVRVDAAMGPRGVELSFRPVTPDLVVAVSDPANPERPIEVREAFLRTNPTTGAQVWTWEVWSIKGVPSHRVLAANTIGQGEDVSHLYGLPEGGAVGDAYPAWRRDGPFLPYVVYHAARTGMLWDPWHGREVVEGTLNVGVLWTFFAHCVRNASWPQRYTIGAEPAGANLEGDEGVERVAIPADPAFVMAMKGMEGMDGQPVAGQWSASADPKSIAEALGMYERRLAAYAGLDPSDVQRVSGDPRSGYALAISREGRRDAQRRYAPIFAPSDIELLGVCAALANQADGSLLLPEWGWGLEYEALPASPDELAGQREHVLGLLAAQLIDHDEAREMLGLARRSPVALPAKPQGEQPTQAPQV